jgi:spermidine synthase
MPLVRVPRFNYAERLLRWRSCSDTAMNDSSTAVSKHAGRNGLQLHQRESALRAIIREYLAITLQEIGSHAAARRLRARPSPRRVEYVTPPDSASAPPFPQSVLTDEGTSRQSPGITHGITRGITHGITLTSLIVDCANERHLQFSPEALQSRMRLDDPYALIAPYTRQMMSFLLFNPDPARILMIGLGGGSLAKFCYRHLPNTQITVVEIDARVIALRDSFYIPADDQRFRVIHDDGANYLAAAADPVDVILVDAYDEGGVAPSLASTNFFRDVSRNLTSDGVLVMNLHGEPADFATHLQEVRASFSQRALLVSVASNDNALLCAFGKDATPPAAIQLFLRARYLQSKLKLHFRNYLQRLRDGQVL